MEKKEKTDDGASEGPIMERKRPRLGADTFSSNLGRKVSPTPPTPTSTPESAAKGRSRTVKSWARHWDAAAAAAGGVPPSPSSLSVPSSSSAATLGGGSQAPEVSPSPSALSLTPTPTPSKPRRLRGPHEPDENDLTLLDYKQYMTNVPLARRHENLVSPSDIIAGSSSSKPPRPGQPLPQDVQAAKDTLATLDSCFPPFVDEPTPSSEPDIEPESTTTPASPEPAPVSQPQRTEEETKAYWDTTRKSLSTSWDELEEDDIFRPPSFVLPPPLPPRPHYLPPSPLLHPIIEEHEDESNEHDDQYQRNKAQYQQEQYQEYQPNKQQYNQYQAEQSEQLSPYHQEEQYHDQQQSSRPLFPTTPTRPSSHQPLSPSVHTHRRSRHQTLSLLLPLEIPPPIPPRSPLRPLPPPTRAPPPPPPSHPPPPIPVSITHPTISLTPPPATIPVSLTPPIQLSPPQPPPQQQSPPAGAAARHLIMKREQFLKKLDDYINSPYNPESANYIGPEEFRVRALSGTTPRFCLPMSLRPAAAVATEPAAPETTPEEALEEEEEEEEKVDKGKGRCDDMYG